METVAVENPGRDGDLNDVMQKQRARAFTPRARLRPRFPTSAALVTCESNRDFDGHRHTATCFSGRYMNSCVPPWRLVREEASANAVDREGHRREVDHDFVGEAADVHTTIVGCHESNWLTTEWTEGVSGHQSAGTIGIGRGEVNGQ